MSIYQQVNCRVYLVGCLKEKPELMMDNHGDFIAKIVVDRKEESYSSYQVFIYGELALRIRQYGFIGLYLWIEGDFQNNGEIIAEKVQFLDFFKPGGKGDGVANYYC